VRRALEFVLRNWPLKLAAIGLATVLYAGVVLSENTRSWPGQVAITVVDPPPGGVLLAPPGSVSAIRYRAPLDVAGQLTGESFRATVDLSGLEPQAGGPAITVPVRLTATDPRVEVVDFSPRTMDVRLDSVVARRMPVTVERGVAPEGLVLGPPQVEPATVLVRGASSRVDDVQAIVARIVVDASGLNIDGAVELEATDEAGDLVPGVEVTPGEARVRIDVARELAYAVLPVVVDLAGTPAAGFRIDRVEVDPAAVTVSGEAPAVERLASVRTAAVPVDGLTEDWSGPVALLLPSEISLIGDPEARVTIGIGPAQGSRAIQAGLVPVGARRDRVTTLSTGSVLVTVSGDIATLDALGSGETAPLVGEVDVTGLGNGRHEVPVTVSPPAGISVISVAPSTVVARIALPSATPTPETTPQGTQSPATTAPGASPPAPAVGRSAEPAPSVSPSPAAFPNLAGDPSPAPSGGS
jgi:YbbR domain-containing protein